MGTWKWSAIAKLAAGAVIGIGGSAAIWLLDAPRWAIAISGVLAVGGAACTLPLLACAILWVQEDVQPRIVGLTPKLPLSLATEQSALVGQRRFGMHRVRRWFGITLSDRVFFGVLLFGPYVQETFDAKR